MLRINYQHSSSCLDAQTELSLIKKAQRGNNDARNKLILAHMAFLRWMCIKYSLIGHYSDFIGDAIIGMIEAINRFDATKTTGRLISFAHLNVKNKVLRSDFNKKMIALSYRSRDNLWEMEKAEVKLHSDDKYITIESLSKLTNLSVKTISELQSVQESVGYNCDYESLHKPADDNHKQTYLDFVSDETAEMEYEKVNIRVDLDYFLSHLTHRERFIVERRFGIPVEMNNEQIAKRLDIGYNTVTRTFQRAMRKLRNLAEALQGNPDEVKLVVENPDRVMAR